jgi:hypothetical protein
MRLLFNESEVIEAAARDAGGATCFDLAMDVNISVLSDEFWEIMGHCSAAKLIYRSNTIFPGDYLHRYTSLVY